MSIFGTCSGGYLVWCSIAGVLKKFIRWIGGRHHCRNTALDIGVASLPGKPDYLLVTMVDKCTGGRWEATFSPPTSVLVLEKLTQVVARIRQSDDEAATDSHSI
jgi:hypothetical protein